MHGFRLRFPFALALAAGLRDRLGPGKRWRRLGQGTVLIAAGLASVLLVAQSRAQALDAGGELPLVLDGGVGCSPRPAAAPKSLLRLPDFWVSLPGTAAAAAPASPARDLTHRCAGSAPQGMMAAAPSALTCPKPRP